MKFGIGDFDRMGVGNFNNGNMINYFSLKDDGDSCDSRFLYESPEDVEGYVVHRVTFPNGKSRWVTCIRDYEDPASACPLCSSPVEADRKQYKKIWIPVYRIASRTLKNGEIVVTEHKDVALWERSADFFNHKIYPLMVEKGTPFCGHVFNIERKGVAGIMEVDYEILEDAFDESILEDFGEIPNPIGTIVLEKSYAELADFVRTRNFAQQNNNRNGGGYTAPPASNNYAGGQIDNRYGNNNGDGAIKRRGTRPNIG